MGVAIVAIVVIMRVVLVLILVKVKQGGRSCGHVWEGRQETRTCLHIVRLRVCCCKSGSGRVLVYGEEGGGVAAVVVAGRFEGVV